MLRAILSLLAAAMVLWPSCAEASVRIDFRSRDTDSRFPHAFVVLTGTVDSTGEVVDANYGFTLVDTINVTILAIPAAGQIHSVRTTDVPNSNLHFSLTLTDEEYARVMRVVEEWRNLPQPSYVLMKRNCVTFVSAVATELGLDGSMVRGLELKPHGFLDSVTARNRTLIAARGGTLGPATTVAASTPAVQAPTVQATAAAPTH